MDDLARVGMPEGRVYFAGEHCSAEAQQSVDGAWDTGVVAAKAIIQRIRDLSL